MLNAYFILYILILLSHLYQAIRSPDGLDPLVPDYAQEYYYTQLEIKMNESMSINNCSLYGSNIPIAYGGSLSPENSDLTVQLVPPSATLLSAWSDQANQRLTTKVFAKANNHLCKSTDFRDFKKGYFRRSKGCYKTMIIDKHGNTIKRINRYGATLHPDHIRCDIMTGGSICGVLQGSREEIVSLPPKLRYLNSFPFIIKAKRAIVAKSGMIALPCGPFGLLSSCEAVNWGVSTAAAVVDRVTDCQEYYDDVGQINNSSVYCPFPRLKKVFLMSQYDDTQIGQFMMESFPRLVYHLDYLRSHPDILIHFGFTKRESVPSFTLPQIFINWLGLGDRLRNGTFFADEIIMSREGGCQDAGYNAWEVVNMRDRFIQMLNLPSDQDLKNAAISGKLFGSIWRPTIVILIRSKSSKYVQNKGDRGLRGWPEGFVSQMIPLLAKAFPNHAIKAFSDQNSTLMSYPPAQIEMFRYADIAIGYHGAGLSNTMYMKPGGVVVEIVPRFDSRHAPAVGIFPRLSGIIGLHHFTYFVKNLDFQPETLVADTASFYNNVKLWANDH